MDKDNNNNQTVPGVTPVTQVPETPVTPVTPGPDHMEAHPVPSLVIEDNAQVETPVSPVTSTPVDTPVAPVTPVTPVQPETPVAPVTQTTQAPVTPVSATPVAPVTPVAQPEAPVQPTTAPTETPVAPATPNGEANAGAETKPVKKNHNVAALIVIFACLVVAVVYFLSKKNDTPTPTPAPTPSLPENPTGGDDLSSLSLNQASFNGVTFTFPETKTTFNNVGWAWEASYAQNDVEPGIGTNGGRVGTAPGGASVLVINKGTAPAHIEDCTIYSATFYNPKDGSENVTFVGGLTYTSTPDTVKARMIELGYKKVSETTNENTLSLKYFLNDDSTNTNDYVEFYFVDNVVETVTISTAI